MKAKTQYSLMSSEERKKVVTETLNFSARDGLLGQFPEFTKDFKARTDSMKHLFVAAESNVNSILESKCFSGFRNYVKKQKADSLVAEDLSEIITGQVKASKYTHIWSAIQYDNQGFKLILHEGKLKLCVPEYIYQSEHMRGGIHWYRIIKDEYRAECDSYRLHQILTILANHRTAWTYLRARVYAREFFANNPQY
jgi:hypothetical protein